MLERNVSALLAPFCASLPTYFGHLAREFDAPLTWHLQLALGSCQLQVVTTACWLAALQLLQAAPVYMTVIPLGVFSCFVCTLAGFAS